MRIIAVKLSSHGKTLSINRFATWEKETIRHDPASANTEIQDLIILRIISIFSATIVI